MAGGFLKGLFEDKSGNKIIEILKSNRKITDSLFDRITALQENVLRLATSVAEHKQVITFLLNHSSFDEDGKEDLVKMLENINSLNKKVKK